MPLTPGARLGPYVVRALIGSGGMGEVYRAHDARLGRDVALKIIGATAARDADMRRRFDEEARLAASLDHPRICAIYDVGHSDGVDYLVMELLQGETLATRLSRGPLPEPELIEYAIEIASALAYAHARGVVHRDIKPGNVFLTDAGVKIVDFGLATLRRLEHLPSADMAGLNTRKLTAAERNIVLGTPEYLSPERLDAQEGDHRGDIFAFGLVLYEMATGRRAFEGASPASLIAAIMSAEPPPMVGHGTATPEIEWIVRRCLKKAPDARWQSMSDVEAVLKWRASSMQSRTEQRAKERSALTRYLSAVAAAVVLVGVVWLTAGARNRDAPRTAAAAVAVSVPPPDEGRFTLTDATSRCAQLAVSPDGRLLAFVAIGGDRVSQIWIRPIDSIVAQPVSGTANATYPFWSPDSRSLGFFADRQLRRIDLGGGPPRVLADAPNGRGGTWSVNNVILFAPLTSSGLSRVNADGTGLVEQTSLVSGEVSHRWPQFLPDGKHFVFFGRNPQASDGVYLATVDTPDRTLLVASRFAGAYAPPNYLLYITDGTLMTRTLDVEHARLSGEPMPLVVDVGGSSNFYGAFSASATGVLAYARSASAAELVWMDRAGHNLGVAAERASYSDFDISGDRRYLATAEAEPHAGHPDIHVHDLQRGSNSRITSARATDASPVWSPDGARLVFRSNRDKAHDLYWVVPNSSAREELLLSTDAAKYPTDWSADGRLVVYHSDVRRMGWDIWAMPVEPRGQPTPLVATVDDEVQGRLSRNGRWLAYTWFTAAEKPEVYAKALGGDESRVPVSVDGGSDPHWSRDDRELFYIAADGMLMSVPVQPEAVLNPGKPRPLFRIPGMRVAPPYASRYDVDPSGQRFLVLVPLDDPQTFPLNVLVNWTPPAMHR